MRKKSNKELIFHSVYKSHIILMIVSVIVGMMSLYKCPSSGQQVQADIPTARLVVNQSKEAESKSLLDQLKGKGNPSDKEIRYNAKPECKSVKPSKKEGNGNKGGGKVFWIIVAIILLLGSLYFVASIPIALDILAYEGAGAMLWWLGILGGLFLICLLLFLRTLKKLKRIRDHVVYRNKV